MSKSTDVIRRLLLSRVFLIVNVVVLCFLFLSFGRQWVRNASIESEIADLTRQKAELEARNNELLSLGQTIQTQYYLEKEGRLKYGLAKPGEQLVVVTDPANGAVASQTSDAATTTTTSDQADALAETSTPASASNPARWWAYFFNSAAYAEMQKDYGS